MNLTEYSLVSGRALQEVSSSGLEVLFTILHNQEHCAVLCAVVFMANLDFIIRTLSKCL